jgi:hypothetical protein
MGKNAPDGPSHGAVRSTGQETTILRPLTWLAARGPRIRFCTLGVMAVVSPAFAASANYDGWQINLDTTLSSSVDLRTSPINRQFVGVQNGGSSSGANADNGTLNYKPGTPVAATQRITTELQATRDDYGAFLRATGFYDPITDSETTDFQKLSRAAVRDVGADLRLLDAYVFTRPVIFGHAFDVRIGPQALNWGESTFIQFGINAITPLDVTALRVTGAELRTAFLPVPAVDVRTQIGQGVSLEAFWQFAWVRDKLEPDGSFFSTGDTIFDGGTYGVLRADDPDAPSSIYAVNASHGNAFGGGYPRSADRHPTSLAEFGAALRLSPSGWSDTEIGLYFESYNSRTPFGSYRTGRRNISGLPGALSVLPDPLATLLTGGQARVDYNSTASFFADYPSEIHLIGASFNTTIAGGIALQGEISDRLNQPIQLASADLALAVSFPAIAVARGLLPAFQQAYLEALQDPTIQAAGFPGFNQTVNGWKRFDVTQIQATATKLFTGFPDFKINSVAWVSELGADYVHDFPRDRGEFNAFYSTDSNSSTTHAATVDGNSALSTKGLASAFSSEIVTEAIIDMPNLLPRGIGMQPTLSLKYDFLGSSPVGVNVFQANTASASVGVQFAYLQAITFGVQYTNHFPVFAGGRFYGSIDRDFVSAVATVEF